MFSATYGRMIRRHEGASPVSLDEQFRMGKVEAMSLLSAASETSSAAEPTAEHMVSFKTPSPAQGGPTGGPMGRKLPLARRRKVAV